MAQGALALTGCRKSVSRVLNPLLIQVCVNIVGMIGSMLVLKSPTKPIIGAIHDVDHLKRTPHTSTLPTIQPLIPVPIPPLKTVETHPYILQIVTESLLIVPVSYFLSSTNATSVYVAFFSKIQIVIDATAKIQHVTNTASRCSVHDTNSQPRRATSFPRLNDRM